MLTLLRTTTVTQIRDALAQAYERGAKLRIERDTARVKLSDVQHKYDLLLDKHLELTSKLATNLTTRGVKTTPFKDDDLEQPPTTAQADRARAIAAREAAASGAG